jgi:hypothetical protein
MTQPSRIRDAVKKRFDIKRDKTTIILGELGDSYGAVNDPSAPGYVYVTVYDTILSVFANQTIPRVVGLPVLIGYSDNQPDMLQVLEVRVKNGNSAYAGNLLGNHHQQHEWPNTDTVYVNMRQILPLRLIIVPPYSITIYPGFIWIGGHLVFIDAPASPIDLTNDLPLEEGKARFIWFTINPLGAIVKTVGDIVDQATLAINTLPALPPTAEYVLGGVRLFGGQHFISEALSGTDIFDARLPYFHRHADESNFSSASSKLYWQYYDPIGGTGSLMQAVLGSPNSPIGASVGGTVNSSNSPHTITNFETFDYLSQYPNIDYIPAGRWRFVLPYTKTGDTTCTVRVTVYRTFGGTITNLFHVDEDVTAAGNGVLIIESDQPVWQVGYNGWRLGFKLQLISVEASSTTMNFSLFLEQGRYDETACYVFVPAQFIQPPDIDALNDVNAPAPSDGDLLTWDGEFAQWKNKPPAGSGGATYAHIIQDDGHSLPDRVHLNFYGPGVTVSDNSIDNSSDVNIFTDGDVHGPSGSVSGHVAVFSDTTGKNIIDGGPSGTAELLMADGVSSPPVPLDNEDGDDWLYGG